MSRPNTAARAVTFDRARLEEAMCHTREEPAAGMEDFGDYAAEQIAGAVLYAEQERALSRPEDIEMIVQALRPSADAVTISLRESFAARASQSAIGRAAAGLPRERQVSSWSTPTSVLMPEHSETFEGVCETLGAVCEEATRLLPCLDALRDGEDMLMSLISAPLTVLTYNDRGRLASYRANVGDVTEGDPDQAKMSWALLIETLERGEADEDWDGSRQRAFRLQPNGEPHLARQLHALREELIAAGDASAEQLPEPDDGLDAYLA